MKMMMLVYFFCWMSSQLLNVTSCKTESTTEKPATIVESPLAPLETPKGPPVLKPVFDLPEVLHECSGLIDLSDGQYVGLNDSGNKPYLYVFNPKNNKQVRTVRVTGVVNNDWEELAEDGDHIYIGDFGNNGGKRQNLMIYKIKKEELKKGNEVSPETIKFRYAGQTKFRDSNLHNFDCESMIVRDDSIYLFSKNRGDFRTDVYGLPNVPGDYVTSVMGSFDSEGLVTGADFKQHGDKGQLVLIGYSVHGKALYPFILHFPEVEGNRFLEGKVNKISFEKVLQTETILFHNDHSVYLTNEEEDGSEGRIYQVDL